MYFFMKSKKNIGTYIYAPISILIQKALQQNKCKCL